MWRTRFASLLAAAAIIWIAAWADGSDAHGGDARGWMQPAAAAGSGVGGAFAALRATRDAIAADIDAGRLGEIHEKSGKLVPQGQTLLERSSDLAPERRARVESALKQLPGVADALHKAADAGKAEEARGQLKRLDGLLELVRAQYPPAALATSDASIDHAAMGHDMAMHGKHEGGTSMPGHAHAAKPLASVDAAAKSTIAVTSEEFKFESRILRLRAGEPTRIELVNHVVGAR